MIKKSILPCFVLAFFACSFLSKAMERELDWQGIGWKQAFLIEHESLRRFFSYVTIIKTPCLMALTQEDLWYNPARKEELMALIKKDHTATHLLYAATRCKFVRGVRVALAANPDITMRGKNYTTIMHDAAKAGSIEVMQALIDAGGDVNAQDVHKATPLHSIFTPWGIQKNIKMVQLLLAYVRDIHDRDRAGETVLHRAARSGDSAIVELLIDRGANVNKRDECMQTPLHIAAQSGRVEVVQLLLKNGAYCEARDNIDATPLYRLACSEYSEGRLVIAQLLLDHGANVSAESIHNAIPLHRAIQHNNTALAQLLLSHGTDINAVDIKKRTPLHWAADCGHWQMVILLLNHGADSATRDEKGDTPIDLAVHREHVQVIKLLLDHGATITPEIVKTMPLHRAAANGNCYVLEVLLSLGMDVNARNAMGATPLHSAVTSRHIKTIKLLLEHGAKVTAEDMYGRTPLKIAKRFTSDMLIKNLLMAHNKTRCTLL